MTEAEKIRRWVEIWNETGPQLERIRLQEMREQDTQQALEQLARLFNQATRSLPPAESSGLVEMQRYLAILRERS